MHLPSLLSHFPPVAYGFAYGSGVFHQAGLYDTQELSAAKGAGPMLDMIVVVDDPVQWHAQVGACRPASSSSPLATTLAPQRLHRALRQRGPPRCTPRRTSHATGAITPSWQRWAAAR